MRNGPPIRSERGLHHRCRRSEGGDAAGHGMAGKSPWWGQGSDGPGHGVNAIDPEWARGLTEWAWAHDVSFSGWVQHMGSLDPGHRGTCSVAVPVRGTLHVNSKHTAALWTVKRSTHTCIFGDLFSAC